MKKTPASRLWGLIFLGFFLLFFSKGMAADISTTGGWNLIIDSSNLTGGSGSDLTSTYTSAANATIIDIPSSDNSTWHVYINRADTNWPSAFTLYAIRTSNGSGAPNSSVSGGTSYQSVTTNQVQFFTGKRTRSDINIQYQLSGVSISIPPGSYSTTVIYTVTP